MKKKLLSSFLLICIILTFIFPLSTLAYNNGSCGENLQWFLDDNGILTISGTGEMFKYHFINEIENGKSPHQSIPPWYKYQSDIKQVKISAGVTSVSDCAFFGCENVVSVEMPETVEKIGYAAFQNCKNMKSISLSPKIKKINDSTFWGCQSLSKIIIPHGVKRIENMVFSGCTNLKAIYFPETVEYIADWQGNCSPTYVFYEGNESDWNSIFVLDSVWTYNIDDAKVFCNANVTDISNLIMVYLNGNCVSFDQLPVIKDGRTLVPLRAIFEAMGATVDWNNSTKTVTSKLDSTTIQLTIGSNILYKNKTAITLDVPAQLINGYTMVPARAVAEAFGAEVNWDDNTQSVYIKTKGNTYSVNSVPKIICDGYDANFADFNGMYIDSFTHSSNNDGTENIKFNVYNSSFIYGVVEIYYPDGTIKDAAIIDKMSNSTSIKEVLIDDTGRLVRDLWNGTALTYKQESGYSKHTAVDIDVPQGGYIKITNDPMESFIAGVINAYDIILSANNTLKEANGFSEDTSSDLAEELSKKLIHDTVFKEMVNNPLNYTHKLWAGLGNELYMNAESVGGYLDTVSTNLNNFSNGDLTKLVLSTAADCGMEIAEGTFISLSGPAGIALKTIFTMTTVTDFLIQLDDSVKFVNKGSINIIVN